MRKHFILLLMTAVFLLSCFVSVGQVLTADLTTERFENFPSAHIESTLAWKSPQWEVDENMGKLFAENNFSEKPLEYFSYPYKTVHINTNAGNGKNQLLHDGHISDNYLNFTVYEFNPITDSNNSILKDPVNTFIPGSDMGDLTSMYAILEYQRVFGCASCHSTRWPKTFKTSYNLVPVAFLKYIRDNVPLPNNHKIYFAYGTELLDPTYKPSRQQVNKIMKIVGYTPINWFTKEFPGASHAELAWSTRFYISLMILLGK